MGTVSFVCINPTPRWTGIVKMTLSIWPQQSSPGTGHDLGKGCSISDAYILVVSNIANYVRSLGIYGDTGEDLF